MAATKEQVAELYVAFFDRASDSAGLDYWVNSGMTIEGISQSFFDQVETQAKYPDTFTNTQFITEIYNNLFNSSPDDAGLAYWVKELDDGNISRGNMILAVVNGAQGTDDQILANKTEVALYFADAGLDDVEDATAVMVGVSEDPQTVIDAEKVIDALAGVSVILTVEQDTITTADHNDVIKGVIDNDGSTLQSVDIIDSGGGNDTLEVSLIKQKDIALHMSNVETMDINVLDDNVFNMNAVSGLETIKLSGVQSSTVTFDDLKNLVDIEYKDAVNIDAEINYAASVVAGNSDTMKITMENSTGEKINDRIDVTVAGIETIDIVSNGATVNFVEIRAVDMSSLNISGDADLRVGNFNATSKLISIDGSKATGDLTLASVQYDGTADFRTITTGGGDDYVYGSQYDDIIVGGTGKDNLNGGEGNDIITGGIGKDRMTGGDGDDIFVIAAGDTGLVTADVDFIDDFEYKSDQLKLGVAGTVDNYLYLGDDSTYLNIPTVEEAVALANAATGTGTSFDGTIQYMMVNDSAGDDVAYLIVDSDLNGEADYAINLHGFVMHVDDIIA